MKQTTLSFIPFCVEYMRGKDFSSQGKWPQSFFIVAGLISLLALAVPVASQCPDWNFEVGNEYISSIDISSDGSRILAGTTMGEVYFLDDKGRLLWTLQVPGRLIARIAPDNSSFIVGSQESRQKDKGAVRCYSMNGTCLWREVTGWVTDIDFSRDAEMMVVGTRMGDVIVLDSQGNKLGSYNDFPKTYVVNAVGISGDASRIAYSLCEIKPALEVVTVSNGRRRVSTRVENSNLYDMIKLSGDGKYIVTKGGEGTISELALFDENTKKIWSKDLYRIHDLAINEDGGLVLAASDDSFLRVYAISGDPLWNFSRSGGITALSVNLDKGLIASGSGDGNIDVLSFSGDTIWTFLAERFPESRVTAVKVSGDGDSLIAVLNDKEIVHYSLVSDTSPETDVEASANLTNTGMIPDSEEIISITPTSVTVNQRFSAWNFSQVPDDRTVDDLFVQAAIINQDFLDLFCQKSS